MMFKKNEKTVLRKTERAMVRAMCDPKVENGKTIEEQVNMLELEEIVDGCLNFG